MAEATLAWRGPPPGTDLQNNSSSGNLCHQTRPQTVQRWRTTWHLPSTCQTLPFPSFPVDDGQKLLVLPRWRSSPEMSHPSKSHPSSRVTRKEWPRAFLMAGEPVHPAHRLLRWDKVHRYISPLVAGTFASPPLSPHSCIPLTQDFNALFSPPLTWKAWEDHFRLES